MYYDMRAGFALFNLCAWGFSRSHHQTGIHMRGKSSPEFRMTHLGIPDAHDLSTTHTSNDIYIRSMRSVTKVYNIKPG